MSQINIVELECREQPIQKIIVFNDRAEITRNITVDLREGVNELHIKNVPQAIVRDSLRVDGRGDAVIHEVLTKDKVALVEEKDSPKVAEIRGRLKEKQGEVNALKDKQNVLNKRIEALDKVVTQFGSNMAPKEEALVVDDTFLQSMTKFYAFYDEQSTAVRAEARGLVLKLEKAEEELDKVRDELNQADMDQSRGRVSKTFVIVLESKAGGKVDLNVVYQVFGASWYSTYDLRVNTSDKPTVKVSYYGQISQNTGEDWKDVPLILSTAQPCLGGNIPDLGVLEASFYRASARRSMVRCMAASPMAERNFLKKSARVVLDDDADDMLIGAAEPMEYSTASKVQEKALSTEFTIGRPSTIPSGHDTHKVTIGIVDLKPHLVYECVPSKTTSVFLTAAAVNESLLPFLAGEASVYLNNSFVAKTHLKNISPGERFSCSLGVDTSIRVEYRPVKKYHEQVGLINKSSSNITEQVINVKNTRNSPVVLTIREHIPRSTDEKIKIRMVNPSPIAPFEETSSNVGDAPQMREEGAKMNVQGNLEWTVKLAGGKSQDLMLKWAMDHPKEEKVVFNEKF